MKYLQIIDGIVRHAFAGPQVAKDWPGLVEVDDEDSRYVTFVTPIEPDKTAMAYATRDSLLAVATVRVGPLQDAVDTGRATDEDTARLMLWKGYRVDLNRIDQQAGFPQDIQWPPSPDDEPMSETAPVH